MPSDFVHLPYAQLETPEVSTEWMRYFRQRVEEELRRTNNTLNRVDQNTISVVDELSTVPTPAAASFYSISAAEGTIYVQLSCSETVTGFELCATTVSGTRKQIMYAESNATTGRGHFEFPSLEAVFLWGRTVNKGTWAEARSGWTQYLATTALQFTNILTDTITGGLGQVANFVEMTVNPFAAYNRLTYNTNRIHSTGDILVHGYWDSSVVQMGSHGVRIRYQHKGPTTLSPQTYDGFLFMVPDTAMDGTPATWNGKKCYFAGFTKVGTSVYALIALYTCVAPMDHYNSPNYFGVDGAPTYLDISTDLVTAGYCDADGFGAFEIRVEDNTFYIYGGASYGTLLASATDTTYLLGSARNGIGFLKPDQSWIDDEIALTIDHVNYVTGPDANSVDPGVVAIDRGGTNNNSYTTDQFLEYDSTSGRIQSSGYGPSSFAPSPHDILSTHHGDTTAAAVVRGDIITGQGATPKWTRLAKGTNYQFLTMDATAADVAWTSLSTIAGSGTNNYIPKFLVGATPSFADSIMSQTGTTTITTLCSDAATSTITDIHVYGHNTSGTPTTGYGSALRFQLESSTTESQDAALIQASWVTATHATRTSKVEIWDVHSGTLTPFLHQSGLNNLFLGHRAGNTTVSGSVGRNVGIGVTALVALTTGNYNIGIGYAAIASCTQGSNNLGIGYAALNQVVTGNFNTAFGSSALLACLGSNNVAIGNSAATALTGSSSVAIGASALGSGTSCQQATAIGTNAGFKSSANNGIFIGFESGYFETGANKLFIDAGRRANEADARVKALIYGVTSTTTPNQYLYLNCNVIINEDGQDCDFRVESDGDANNIFSEGSTNRVGIGTGTPAVKLDVVGVTRLGDSATNYTEVEADGTIHLVGTATVFDDLRVSINATKSPAVNAPTWTAYKSGEILAFADEAVNEEYVTFTVQMPHGWKEGSDITPHVHWVPSTDDAADLYVKWGLTYSWANINDDFPAESTVYGTSEAINNEADKHVMTNMTAISGTGKTISSMLICKLFRNSSDAADTYDHDAYLLEFDIHYEIDTMGSRTISAK